MISSWRKKRAARNANKKRDFSLIELSIPNHFRCPISLELMKDPVTLSTGITYDRQSIDTWFEAGNKTCPITNQVLNTFEPIPNHALRKMIQDWCVDNRSYGVERIPTPRIPLSARDVNEILSKLVAARGTEDARACMDFVAKIKGLVKENERNKRCFLANGTASVLSSTFELLSNHAFDKNVGVLEDILSVLTMMSPLDKDENTLSSLGATSSLRGLVWFVTSGDNLSARRNAALVLKHVIVSSDQQKMDEFMKIEGALQGLVKLIKEPICPTTTKASLVILYNMVSSSSNSNEKVITKFIDMGLVEKLLEMLVDSDRSVCEKALGVLDKICAYDQGKEEAYANALTMPVLVKKILRVSDLATEFSVSILWNLCKNDERREDVLVQGLQVGAFQKLLLLLQFGCDERTKEKATELLKLLNLHKESVECIDSMDFKNLKRPT